MVQWTEGVGNEEVLNRIKNKKWLNLNAVNWGKQKKNLLELSARVAHSFGLMTALLSNRVAVSKFLRLERSQQYIY